MEYPYDMEHGNGTNHSHRISGRAVLV